jgi:MFS transporter, AAHS family, 3-hydroxyphenylpropionic acid transporter
MTSAGAAVRGRDLTGVLTVALCCTVSIIEGFDLQSAGVAAPRLAPALGLNPGQLGLFFSSSTFGLMCGALIGGRLSDYFGRKTILLISVAWFGVMSIATGLSSGFTLLLLTRFLTGVGLGGALPNLLALVAENTTSEHRSSAIATLYAGLPTGGAIASIVTFLDKDPASWRMIFFIGGIAPLIVIPLLYWVLPDSKRLHADSHVAKPPVTQALFGGDRNSTTLLLWLGFLLGLLVFYLLLNWLPSLLVSRGLSRPDASLVQLAFNVAGAIGSVAVGLIMDVRSKWVTTAAAFVASIVAILILAVAPADLMLLIAAGAAVGATISASQMVLYSIAPGCYPTMVRGTGVGAAVAVGRVGSAIGPLLAGLLLGSGQSNSQVMMSIIPILAISGVAATILAARIKPEVDVVDGNI